MLIGLTGPAGAGKDTVAGILRTHYGYTQLSFAATIKNMLRLIEAEEPSKVEDKEKLVAGFNFTYRKAMQTLGDWGRELDPDIWIKLTMWRVCPNKTVISDVRFNNEAEAIRRVGGRVVHIVGRKRDLGENANHISEAGVICSSRDLCLVNTGSLEQLKSEIEKILQH